MHPAIRTKTSPWFSEISWKFTAARNGDHRRASRLRNSDRDRRRDGHGFAGLKITLPEDAQGLSRF